MAKEPQPEVSAAYIDAVAALQHAIFLHLTDVGEDRDAFFAWMRSILANLGLVEEDGKDYELLAYWFARQFWNAIPLESNGFRPLPLPLPKSGAPCPCGSGSTFRECCEPWVPLDELPENVLWPALVQSRPDEYWIAASREGRLPPEGVVHAADYLFEAGLWEDIVDLVEPWFVPGRTIDEALADVIPPLCEAYNALNDSPQQKEELLRRLVGDPGARIRCVANQQLASWLHDQGDRDEAWRTIEAAERDVPGEPMTAMIELTMLCAERRFDRIPDRAAYWLQSVGRSPLASEHALTSIRTFRDDPKRGRDDYYRLTLPDDGNELLDWIDENADRRRPTLRWRRVRNEDQDENLRGAHLPLVPAKSRALERRWRRLSGLGAWTIGENVVSNDRAMAVSSAHRAARDRYGISIPPYAGRAGDPTDDRGILQLRGSTAVRRLWSACGLRAAGCGCAVVGCAGRVAAGGRLVQLPGFSRLDVPLPAGSVGIGHPCLRLLCVTADGVLDAGRLDPGPAQAPFRRRDLLGRLHLDAQVVECRSLPTLEEDQLQRRIGDREVRVAGLHLRRGGVEQAGVERDRLVEIGHVDCKL